MKAQPIALKWALGILFAGFLSIAIPLVHFVSVPAALLGAPIAYFLILRLFSSGVSVSGNVVCPCCRENSPCRESATRLPIQFQCGVCRATCSVDRKSFLPIE